MCLDTARALHREPQSLEVLEAELALARGGDRRLDAQIDRLLATARGELAEAGLRSFCRDLVVTEQAALLARHAPSVVADAFIASRIPGEGAAFGLLPPGLDQAAIVGRAALMSSG